MDRLQEIYCGEISERLQPYEYGRFNLIGRQLRGVIDPGGTITIYDFYHRNPSKTDGDCVELNESAYRDLRVAFQELHFYRCEGTEPRHFFQTAASHSFLIAAERSLLKSSELVISDPYVIADICVSNLILIDPAFKKVAALSNSGYLLRRILGENHKADYSSSLILPDNQGRPLGFGTPGHIVYFCADFENGGPCFGIQKAERRVELVTPSDQRLRQHFRANPRLESIVDALVEAELDVAKPFAA